MLNCNVNNKGLQIGISGKICGLVINMSESTNPDLCQSLQSKFFKDVCYIVKKGKF